MRNCVYLKIIFVLSLFVTNTNCNANGNYTIVKDTIVPKKHLTKNSSLLKTTGTAPYISTDKTDQIYCPGTTLKIVKSETISVDPVAPPDAVYIQISSGYAIGDKLDLVGTNPNITTIWIPSEGKLKLTGPGLSNSTTFKKAIENVVFNNSLASASGIRTFSISLGNGSLSYLPSNKHFYEYVKKTGITWTDAESAAKLRVYYSLKGYLATLTAADEAQLAGAQAEGAGWIGGSDDVSQGASEGNWKWVTGPEGLANSGTGTPFWVGEGKGGRKTAPFYYANWNNNDKFSEPNNAGDENFAHVVDESLVDTEGAIKGSWNDLSNTGDTSTEIGSHPYQPKGYIVEYGGMPGDPILHVSDYTTMTISTITSPTPNPVCDSGVFTLSAVASTGNVYWYDASGNLLTPTPTNTFTTPTLSTTTTYYVDAGCPGTRTPVTATVNPLPNVSDITIVQCSENLSFYSTFNLTVKNNDISMNFGNETFTYYKTLNGANTENLSEKILDPIAFKNTSANETVWARVANKVTGCFSTAQIDLKVSVTQLDPTFHENLKICDDALPNDQDGFSEFDFHIVTSDIQALLPSPSTGYSIKYYITENDALSEINAIPNPSSFRNTIKDTQDIWVRIDNDLDNSCFGIGAYVTLIVKPVPKINLNTNGAEDTWVCDNLPYYFVTLTAGIQDGSPPSNYDYIWKMNGNPIVTNSATLDVYEKGVYTVEVIDKSPPRCSRTRTITVKPSNSATILPFKIVDLADVNSVTVMVTGLGNYEYSLDEPTGPWQNSTVFDNVSAGIHVVYINDKNGCGVVPQSIAIIDAPKFFTPNNDGYNDYWSVEGINGTFNSKSVIYIFDRYGKLLKQWVPTLNQGWDGTINGIPLPADDYWFTLKLENGREIKGHFSLKR